MATLPAFSSLKYCNIKFVCIKIKTKKCVYYFLLSRVHHKSFVFYLIAIWITGIEANHIELEELGVRHLGLVVFHHHEPSTLHGDRK